MKLGNVSLEKKEEITRMVESRHFLPLDRQKLDKILSKAKLRSIIILMQPLKESLKDKNDFYWAERQIVCSELDETANIYWQEKGMYYFEKKEMMEKTLRKKLGKRFDENPSRYIDEIIETITKKEIYPIVRKRMEEEYKALYGGSWKLKAKGIERERVEYRWHRRYDDLPYPLNMHWDYRNNWIQVYIAIKNGKIFHGRGASASSGSREMHGLYGHKFAEINVRRNVSTEIFVYTDRNKFRFYRRFENLVLIPKDLTGNYRPYKPIERKNLMYCMHDRGFFGKGRFSAEVVRADKES